MRSRALGSCGSWWRLRTAAGQSARAPRCWRWCRSSLVSSRQAVSCREAWLAGFCGPAGQGQLQRGRGKTCITCMVWQGLGGRQCTCPVVCGPESRALHHRLCRAHQPGGHSVYQCRCQWLAPPGVSLGSISGCCAALRSQWPLRLVAWGLLLRFCCCRLPGTFLSGAAIASKCSSCSTTWPFTPTVWHPHSWAAACWARGYAAQGCQLQANQWCEQAQPH